MDKNTIIGLVVIGLILSVFTIFNKPSEEEIKERQAKIEQEQRNMAAADSLQNIEQGIESKSTEQDAVQSVTQDTNEVNSNLSNTTQNSVKEEVKGKLIRIENEKLIIDFDTKGGQIAAVRLKEFESYHNYAKNDGIIEPLVFFKKGDATNGIEFPYNGGVLNTANELFSVKSQNQDRIVFELKKEGNQVIEFVYQFKKDAYDIDYTVNMRGFSGAVTPQNVMFNWNASLRKTERLFSEQRRVSTVCFKYQEEGFSWLSEMGTKEEIAEDKLDWVSFKQSYFSSFINPENGFAKQGSKLNVVQYEKGDAKEWSHLKDFKALVNLNIGNVDNGSVTMNWFFGPNDYKTLTSYDDDYDDVLNYGWGLFRWINLYAVQPVFNLLKSTGMGMGIAILLLTLIIKFALMPVQWKMYVSSAKMRIIKPQVDELNEKYPEKSDALKKQQEMMALYRESGASPLAGCLPMLIQMPILLAVFRFFPSTFDLRQRSFLWAEDLSSYDSIYDLGFNIWPYGDHVSLFTLLMAGTTFIYQMLNSSNMQTPQQPGMPNMKIIMYFFPFMMIFFFNNYSSGLSYYYFISTLVSILIMVLIKKFFVDEDKLKLKMANRKAAAQANPKKKKGKSKFQERLELMQKKQQEQMKNKKK
ncbi:MAG: membrane protein insertase YidC [Fluviicola sp.]|nr:membrane protein insertase YidC [Fluviicola sp.]